MTAYYRGKRRSHMIGASTTLRNPFQKALRMYATGHPGAEFGEEPVVQCTSTSQIRALPIDAIVAIGVRSGS